LVVGAGRSENNNVDAANLLKPLLARGELRCIGATTSEEYKRLILSKDAAFERRFQPVELCEPSIDTATEMLQALAPLYSTHHGVKIPETLIRRIVALSQRRIQGRYLPDKAIDVLDEACCVAAEEDAQEVSPAHVNKVIGRWQPLQGAVHAKFSERVSSWTYRMWSRL